MRIQIKYPSTLLTSMESHWGISPVLEVTGNSSTQTTEGLIRLSSSRSRYKQWHGSQLTWTWVPFSASVVRSGARVTLVTPPPALAENLAHYGLCSSPRERPPALNEQEGCCSHCRDKLPASLNTPAPRSPGLCYCLGLGHTGWALSCQSPGSKHALRFSPCSSVASKSNEWQGLTQCVTGLPKAQCY